MGIVSTTDKREAIETGKIYLSPKFYLYLPTKYSKPKRCKECKSLLKDGMDSEFTQKNLCDQFCKDEFDIKKPLHCCKVCDKMLEPFKRGDGTSASVYPKYCEEHKGYWNKKENKYGKIYHK